MTRTLDAQLERRQERAKQAVLGAVFGGLEDAVAHAGGDLRGFSIKIGAYDTLMTIRADLPSGPMIAYVGAHDLADVLAKAVREARTDGLTWKIDQWAKR
jgi:hypothetical protein